MKSKLILLLAITTLVGCTIEGGNQIQLSENESVELTDLKSQFKADIIEYLTAFNKEDWDHVMDMIYPKLFELISREQMKEVFAQTGQMGMKMETDFKKIERISEIVEQEEISYCRIYYSGGLTIEISDELLYGVSEFHGGLEDYYGEENVLYDENNQTFNIQANKSMIAVLEPGLNSWSYMEYNDQQRQALDMLIPSIVLKQLDE